MAPESATASMWPQASHFWGSTRANVGCGSTCSNVSVGRNQIFDQNSAYLSQFIQNHARDHFCRLGKSWEVPICIVESRVENCASSGPSPQTRPEKSSKPTPSPPCASRPTTHLPCPPTPRANHWERQTPTPRGSLPGSTDATATVSEGEPLGAKISGTRGR